MKRAYFDNNASTPLDPMVREAMLPYLTDHYGNPSSGHSFGERARLGMEEARGQVAALLNCAPDRVVLGSGGSEANNTAILSAVMADPAKRHIVSSRVEHDSVLTPLKFLARLGYEVELLPVDAAGALDLDRLARAIRPDTALVSLMAANNETGVLWDIAAISRICRQHGVLFHTDAIQAAGKVPLDLAAVPVDYLTVAGHKLHGPKGSGALCLRRSAPVTPLVMGSGQEKGRRAGTENVAAMVGFGKACDLAAAHLAVYPRRVAALRDRIEAFILAEIPESRINGQQSPRLANTLNVSFARCSSAQLIQDLDDCGFAVSAHSACQSGDLDPSHVLLAMGVPEEYRHGTLRISLSRFTAETEVDGLLAALPEAVRRSRQGFAG
ncbi:MAG: aminotransferase class V-fold PLP-dependent enzyme [Thermodesulfobacteriota bacterium]